MEKKKVRFPIRVKMIVMIVVFGLVLAATAMTYFAFVNSNSNRTFYKDLATDLSETVALMVDKEQTKEVVDAVIKIYEESGKPSREDPNIQTYLAKFDAVKQMPSYKALQATLLSVKRANNDTDGIYLGYVDAKEKNCVYIVYDEENEFYPVGIVDPLYEEDYPMLENPEIGFVASIYNAEIENSVLVTAGTPIHDENGKIICYALVDITMDTVRARLTNSIIRLFIYLIVTVLLLCIIGIVITYFTLIKPMKTLQKATKSYDAESPESTHHVFKNLKVNTHDEFADLAESMQVMENDVYNKIDELTHINKELAESHRETEKMTELANTDALTGVKNKIAYDQEVETLNQAIAEKKPLAFGVAMIDLNYLKNINDDYGHDRGDAALILLCTIIGEVFTHSQVYRIGGDEFVLILKGADYERSKRLIEKFNSRVIANKPTDADATTKYVSAALGYSTYNASKDTCVDDVFVRADKAMYARKRRMKSQK